MIFCIFPNIHMKHLTVNTLVRKFLILNFHIQLMNLFFLSSCLNIIVTMKVKYNNSLPNFFIFGDHYENICQQADLRKGVSTSVFISLTPSRGTY